MSAALSFDVVRQELVGELAEAPLDLHEGIDDPRAGCKRWPEHLRLLSSQGEMVLGRCRATNLCRYCQGLYVLETVEMLAIDATEYAPSLWAVLTAREHLTRAECRRHLRQLLVAARRRWPAAEWFVQVEFQRRGALHLNLLVKGVPREAEDELRELLAARWCERVDAEPVGQWVGQVEDAGGVVRYLQKTLSHGLKREQAPPIGWRGHRTSQTRGYLVRPASAMREEARAALRLKRELWRAIHRRGLAGHDAELAAQQAIAIAAGTTWRLFHPPAVATSATASGAAVVVSSPAPTHDGSPTQPVAVQAAEAPSTPAPARVPATVGSGGHGRRPLARRSATERATDGRRAAARGRPARAGPRAGPTPAR